MPTLAEKKPRKGPRVTNPEHLRAISLGVLLRTAGGEGRGWKQVHVPYPPRALAYAFRKDVPLVSTVKGHATRESSCNHSPFETQGALSQSYLLQPIQILLGTISVARVKCTHESFLASLLSCASITLTQLQTFS